MYNLAPVFFFPFPVQIIVSIVLMIMREFMFCQTQIELAMFCFCNDQNTPSTSETEQYFTYLKALLFFLISWNKTVFQTDAVPMVAWAMVNKHTLTIELAFASVIFMVVFYSDKKVQNWPCWFEESAFIPRGMSVLVV